MPIIEVDHVTKEFRLGQLVSLRQSLQNGWAGLTGREVVKQQPFKALNDVSFSVEPGEVLGVIGHNGAGKSTLLKILAGISRPTSGSVTVRGRVAPLIEVGAGLVPDLTGRENIRLNGTILGMKPEEIKRKFNEIVAFAELEDFIDTPIKRYSSGMQVRLGFSIATAIDTDILIVDEVLAVGDIAFQRKCYERIEQLIRRSGRTVLLVSHNLRQVERLCSRTVLLDHGRKVFDGEVREACDQYFEATDKRFLSGKGARSSRIEATGDIELLSMKVTNADGDEVSEIKVWDDIVLAAHIHVHRSTILPHFTFGFQTADNFFVAASGSDGALHLKELAVGQYKIVCRVRALSLTPGAYGVFFSIESGSAFAKIFRGEHVASIIVRNADQGHGFHANRTGFCALDSTWDAMHTSAASCAA
jgi:lipopolysaccharide transport system ATP-binding protein